MIKTLSMLLLLASSASPAGEMRSGVRMLTDVPLLAGREARAGEMLLRELTLTTGGKTSYALQLIVRDPATRLFWTQLTRSDRPQRTAGAIAEERATGRYAIAGRRMIVFRLSRGSVEIHESSRRAASVAAAEAAMEHSVEHELATTWPITGEFPAPTARRSVDLRAFLPWQFLADSELHPVFHRLSIDSLSFDAGRYDLALRNEKGAVEHLFFTQTLRPLPTKRAPR